MFERWLNINLENTLLIGPRRSGKTTYLGGAFPELRYVTLDDFDYLDWAKRDPKGFVQSLGATAIIDEIQRVPQLTIAVKQFIDEKKLIVLMTGSSSLGLLDVSADSLAGRIRLVHFPTACWGEADGPVTHSFFADEQNPVALAEAKRQFEVALTYGGFPEVAAEPDISRKAEILRNYRDTYFLRDLAQLSNIENIDGLHAVLNHFGRSIGSHLEVSNFAREAGLSHPTTKKYLHVLTQSELAMKVYGYHFSPAKRYVRASKMYFADNGIFTALRHPVSRGQLVENFVISELEKRRKLGFIASDQFYYYKSAGGAEIDLIFEDEANRLYLIEIKATEKSARRDIRHLRSFMHSVKDKEAKAYVVYLGTEYDEIEGVRFIPISALYRSR
jgi:predicted AAA+ superfamily ATPase